MPNVASCIMFTASVVLVQWIGDLWLSLQSPSSLADSHLHELEKTSNTPDSKSDISPTGERL